jgi:hypothetical protein
LSLSRLYAAYGTVSIHATVEYVRNQDRPAAMDDLP